MLSLALYSPPLFIFIPIPYHHPSMPAPPTPTVIQQRITSKQITYLIVNKDSRQWVRLCDAGAEQLQAILRYEDEKNKGIEAGYHPAGEMHAGEEEGREWGDGQAEGQGQGRGYNLRERVLMLISENEFYGVAEKKEKEEKRERNDHEEYNPKQKVHKKQLKREDSRPRAQPYNSKKHRLVQHSKQGRNRVTVNSSPKQPIDLEALSFPAKKTKTIKKQHPRLHRMSPVQIQLDHSDSQLQIL